MDDHKNYGERKISVDRYKLYNPPLDPSIQHFPTGEKDKQKK
ncbi:hypothetical protein SAMN05660649_04646 [Desulfotomaculum arcticum]|uniref:Uncharacterized protein n=1 Tax=Desulfotruncus arcticus DSM 17038 TaxID=1121424 RepID=A0A1I2YXE6_9FIRM|nr:hypothetical protein [Desulfotruncus arcticus]SFH29846.1 hypothetical protein SAMN05660649_04646 [Desulfotomaculum arcticum] [Desulfotruncus arcticus DSM 17038]